MTQINEKALLLASPEYWSHKVFDLRVGSFHSDMLNEIESGSRSLILAPRGFGKSKATQAMIAWYMIKDPNLRIILCSASYNKAVLFMSAIKRAFEGEYINSLFGDIRGDKWSDNMITLKGRDTNHVEPGLMAIGAGSSSIVGLHEEILVLDDVTDYDTARSKVKNERLIEWYKTAVLPTVMPNSKIILVGTRYGLNDIYSHIIDLGYNVKIYPAINNNKSLCSWIRPLDDTFDGDKLVLEGLNTIKKQLGSVIFDMQMQNDVSLLMIGNIISHEWINYYTNLPKLNNYIISCDPAISKHDTRDSTAIIIGGQASDGNIYIVDYINEQMSFGETINKLESLINKWNPEQVRIEQVGFSEAFITELKIKSPTTLIKGIKPKGDKESRLREVSPIFENGLVFFKQNHGKIIDQLLLFPEDRHDDLVDAIQIFLSYYKNTDEGIVLF